MLGKEEHGYTLMAQSHRYVTVFVGATDDMPSFIKAYAGLPEHIIEIALMDNMPHDPYWIYGGIFNIFLASKSDLTRRDCLVREIHLNKTTALSAMDREKVGTIPEFAVYEEWVPFKITEENGA